MRRLPTASVLAALVFATAADAAGARTVRDGHARFQVLTPTLIRMEYAADDRFENRPTMTAVNRRPRLPPVRSGVERGERVIRTSALTLRYRRGSGPFSASNVRVTLRRGGRAVTVGPTWDGKSPGNLGGWRRSLDLQRGRVPLHDGVLSRDGWYILDDTKSVILESGHPGFSVRPSHTGAYQDGYFFGYGLKYPTGLADLRTLTGAAPLLPRKAFGVWYSRYWPYTEAEYKPLLARFRSERVPLDTLSVDTDFKSEANPATAQLGASVAGHPGRPFAWNGWDWNPALFPDPKRFFDWAHAEGLAVTLNIHPSIGSADRHFASADARAGGLVRTRGQCQIFMVDPLQECGVFDWARGPHADAYFALHEPFERDGVDFWWLDWCCDESRAVAPGLTPDTQINRLYALRSQARGSRWPAFSRIGGSHQAGPGGVPEGRGAFAEHRYSMQFTGDTCATWEMLGFQAKFTASAGNVGLPYVTHDIGSFHGVPEDACENTPSHPQLPGDLYARWVALGTFQPLDRLHSNHGNRLPWEYAGKPGAAAAEFLRLREALVPYLYTLARQSYDTGLPIARPLYLQWPGRSEAYAFDSQFTLGPDVVVAQVAAPGDPADVKVWVPPGTWTDWFTGRRLRGPSTVTLSVPLNRAPVLVRAGAVVVTQPYVETSTAAPSRRLVVDAYPGALGGFELYEDEGVGFAYRRGAFARTLFVHRRRGASSVLSVGPARGRSFPGRPATRSYEVRFAGVARPRSAAVNRRQVSVAYDAATRTASVRTGPASTRATLRVEIR